MARSPGGRGRRYQSDEDRRRAAIHAALRARQRRLTRTPAQFRALSERVRTPFNPKTGKFEPTEIPPKEIPWKLKAKYGARAARYFGWRGRKTYREQAERGKGSEIIGRARKQPKEFTQAELQQLEEQYVASLKKLGRKQVFTPEEMRKRKQEDTKERKPTQERLPPGHLFFPQSAEETAAALRYGISPPVKMWDEALKGGTYEPRLDPERMVYPKTHGLFRKASRAFFQKQPETYAYKSPKSEVKSIVKPEKHDPETIKGLSSTRLRRMLGHRGEMPMSEALKPPSWERPVEVKKYEPESEVRRKLPEILRARRQVIPHLPLHLRSQAEWDAAIAARRAMGAFAVDEFGQRAKRGVTKQYPAETTTEMLWREGRARGKNETDAAYEARRSRLFKQLFPEPEKQIVGGSVWDRDMGVTNENLRRYLTDPRQFDPIERTRIRNAIRRHEERRNPAITYKFSRGPGKQVTPPRTYREVLTDLQIAKEARRKARERAEQLYLTHRAEQAQRVFEKRKKWKARREKWRKSLSKSISGIFGR